MLLGSKEYEQIEEINTQVGEVVIAKLMCLWELALK